MVDLAELENIHEGADFIVAGCGPSAQGFVPPEGSIVLGVNDADRYQRCDYLLLANNWNEFPEERQRVIASTPARIVFYHYKRIERELAPVLGRERLVSYRFACSGLSRRGDGIAFDFSNSSPYIACLAAEYLGARRIGLIGVDLVDHALGRGSRMFRVEKDFRHLVSALADRGVELVNYSQETRLEAVPLAQTPAANHR